MPSRNWMSYTPIGVGIIVGLALLAAVLINQQKRSQGADASAIQHAQGTSERVAEMRVVPVGAHQEPPANPNPNREEWRSERDLEAQQKMVTWAVWMTIASFLGVVVTTIGIVFIKLTLDATRAAVKEAEHATIAAQKAIAITERTAKQELRAYVLADRAHVQGLDGLPIASVFVKNFGQTPAFGVTIWMELKFTDAPLADDAVITRPADARVSRSYLGAGATSGSYVKGPRRLADNEKEMLRNGTAYVYVMGNVECRDLFGKKQRATFRYAVGGHYGIVGDSGPMASCETGNEAYYEDEPPDGAPTA
jgi:hypothetical protein